MCGTRLPATTRIPRPIRSTKGCAGITPTSVFGTVYHNLQKLVAEGKLQVLTLGRTQHFNPLLDSHQHFICETCRRVYDILVSKDEEILPASLLQGGFTVTSHRLAFFGECKACSG